MYVQLVILQRRFNLTDRQRCHSGGGQIQFAFLSRGPTMPAKHCFPQNGIPMTTRKENIASRDKVYHWLNPAGHIPPSISMSKQPRSPSIAFPRWSISVKTFFLNAFQAVLLTANKQ